MERSRKRFNSESHAGNKRKSRRSKRHLSIQEEVVHEYSSDSSMNPKDASSSFVNQSNDITLIPTCKEPYSEDDDRIIIKYFQKNKHLLHSKEDVCIYHVLKAKYSFQKSTHSLQNRLLNVILPNLYKYNVINNQDMIDFYDAANLELPKEFIKILQEEEVPNKKSKTTSDENHQTQCSSPLENTCNNQEVTNNQSEIEISPIPSTSRQCNSQINEAASTSKEKCLNTILGFIQLNNSEGTSVFIPNTEPSISEIQNKLLNDFGIRKESIKIIPKNRYDIIVQLKDTFEKYDELVYDVLKTRIYDEKFIERMLPDARKLFEYLEPFMEKSKRPLQRISPLTSSNIGTKIILGAKEQSRTRNANSEFSKSWSSIEIDNVGQIISTLSDSFDQVTISSNIENHQESNLLNENMIEEKEEPVDQDDVETIVRSPYFEDHLYCKSNENSLNAEVGSVNSNLTSVESTNNIMDFESNLIEHACTPQIMFSKRCREKILQENINVDHLVRMRRPNYADIPNTTDCDENKSDNSETNLI